MNSQDSRKRHTTETPLPQEPAKRTQAKAGGPEKLGSRPLTPTRDPPTSGQAVSRPGGRAGSPAAPYTAPASGAAQAQDDEAGRQQDRGHGQRQLKTGLLTSESTSHQKVH